MPKTGDDSNIELYSAMLLGSTLGLASGYAIESEKVKKKQKNKTFRK